jgi:hypothetical protein
METDANNGSMPNNTDAVVLKPTGTVQIANRFSLVERKLLNTLMYYAQQRRFTPQEHSLPVAEVFYHIGLESSRNHDVLKAAIRKLTGTVVEWNIFGDDRVQEWGVCTFLASGKLARGRIRFRINPEIIEQINHPRLFAKIQLLVQAQFKRRHALVLYEFLIDCISRQKASKLVIKDVTLSKLYQLLGLDESKYAEAGNFKVFNRDIIKPSIEDLNQHSDLKVAVEPVRQSRRVIALNFIVERNTSFQVLLAFGSDDQQDLITAENVDVKSESTKTNPSSAENLLCSLVKYGVGQRKAKALMEEFNEQCIRNNLELVQQKLGDGKEIKNIAAYLVCAIEEDYQSNNNKISASDRAKNTIKLLETGPSSAQKRQQQKLQKEWEKFRKLRAQATFQTLSLAQQNQYREAFLASPYFTGSCRAAFNNHGGWSNPLVEHAFTEHYLIKKLLTTQEETSLEAFCEWKQNAV